MAKYVLISLPSTFDSLKATIADNGSVVPFPIPNFKIGTLDALVQQADDLAKLDSACQALVAKVGDSLRTLYDGDDQKASEQKIVNDSTTPARSVRYELINRLLQSRPTNTFAPSLGTQSATGPINLSASCSVAYRRYRLPSIEIPDPVLVPYTIFADLRS